MRSRSGPSVILCGMTLLTLAACGGGGDRMPDPDGTSSVSIAWGPRLGGSDLSPVSGAEDEFGPEVVGALARAARAVSNGASQSSLVDGDGRTADAISVQVVRDDEGNLVHEVTDGARIVVRVPFYNLPRQGLDLALFTDLIPGIEPDLSSYPHEVLGMWAWDAGGGEVGVFWSRSPSVPPVEFGAASPAGTATYEGDAVGLHASEGAATKFVADVELAADFDNHTVGGEVESFRSLAGDSLGDHSVILGETGFSRLGDPFWGGTTAGGVPGSGTWGGRWSDGAGWTIGRNVRLRRGRRECRDPWRLYGVLVRIPGRRSGSSACALIGSLMSTDGLISGMLRPKSSAEWKSGSDTGSSMRARAWQLTATGRCHSTGLDLESPRGGRGVV